MIVGSPYSDPVTQSLTRVAASRDAITAIESSAHMGICTSLCLVAILYGMNGPRLITIRRWETLMEDSPDMWSLHASAAAGGVRPGDWRTPTESPPGLDWSCSQLPRLWLVWMEEPSAGTCSLVLCYDIGIGNVNGNGNGSGKSRRIGSRKGSVR